MGSACHHHDDQVEHDDVDNDDEEEEEEEEEEGEDVEDDDNDACLRCRDQLALEIFLCGDKTENNDDDDFVKGKKRKRTFRYVRILLRARSEYSGN